MKFVGTNFKTAAFFFLIYTTQMFFNFYFAVPLFHVTTRFFHDASVEYEILSAFPYSTSCVSDASSRKKFPDRPQYLKLLHIAKNTTFRRSVYHGLGQVWVEIFRFWSAIQIWSKSFMNPLVPSIKKFWLRLPVKVLCRHLCLVLCKEPCAIGKISANNIFFLIWGSKTDQVLRWFLSFK